jgi:hypothetical protein
MNTRDFKKHLKDLAHGHHHPEEHDWGTDPTAKAAGAAPAKAAPRKTASKKARKSRSAS